MASTGAARPCIQRALQVCRASSLYKPHQHRALFPFLPIRLASTNNAPPTTGTTPTVPAVITKSDATKPKWKGPKPRPRPNRDHSKNRGLSVMRRTGTRETTSVTGLSLPRPVSPSSFPKPRMDPRHGLWDFFYPGKKPLNTPEQDAAHGRAWHAEELRNKSWEDLHKLWWVCIKERNRIATGNMERSKGRYGYGDMESRAREVEVRKTQNAIKHVLTERFYAWEDARELACNDPSFKFTEQSVAYKDPMEARSATNKPKKPLSKWGHLDEATIAQFQTT